MSGLLTLLSLSIVMAGASFLAGILPLALKLSPSRLRLISAIGTGVLVGTSLIVIIPEGVDTLYWNSDMSHLQDKRWLARIPNQTINYGRSEIGIYVANPISHSSEKVAIRQDSVFDTPGPVVSDMLDTPPKTPTEAGTVGIMQENDIDGHGDLHEGHGSPHHAWIGFALISGFMLMFLIDKIPQYTSSTKSQAKTHHIALNNLGQRFNLTTSLDQQDEAAETFLETSQSSERQNRGFATTTGLVIHAAADGIALGASSSTPQRSLSFIIFFAIMIHKAPAAFGLTSILLKQGLSKRMARAHLILFSLAAPVGALSTWILVRLLGGDLSRSSENPHWWTGILLLFSAGTFLYVAMHSMQETTSMKHHEQHMNGHAINGVEAREAPSSDEKPSLRDLAAACFGMILPLFLQIGHAH